MTLKLRSAAVSHRGLVRDGNQDAVHAGPWLIAVADGMGGMAAGDLASTIAIEAIASVDVPASDEELVPALQGAVDVASARIREAIVEDPARDGMGTTLTALLLSPTGTCVALTHVGDSRAYLLRDRVLTQMTKDDTFVQMLLDDGLISAEAASSHPRRAVITKAVQGGAVGGSHQTMTPQAGDRWLLCSDGLSNVVREEALAEALTSHADLPDCAQRLVELALRAGGPDNIAVIVADVVGVDG